MMTLGSLLLVLLLLKGPTTGSATMWQRGSWRHTGKRRDSDDTQHTLVLPHSRHFARISSNMQHNMHQHRRMLLHAEAASATAQPTVAGEEAGIPTTGLAGLQQQQQQKEQEQQMVAAFLETGHKAVNTLLLEHFRPPENTTAVEQGVQNDGSAHSAALQPGRFALARR